MKMSFLVIITSMNTLVAMSEWGGMNNPKLPLQKYIELALQQRALIDQLRLMPDYVGKYYCLHSMVDPIHERIKTARLEEEAELDRRLCDYMLFGLDTEFCDYDRFVHYENPDLSNFHQSLCASQTVDPGKVFELSSEYGEDCGSINVGRNPNEHKFIDDCYVQFARCSANEMAIKVAGVECKLEPSVSRKRKHGGKQKRNGSVKQEGHACCRIINSSNTLHKHIARFHRSNDNKKHICDLCNKTYQRPSALLYHLKDIHELFFMCCKKIFLDIQALQEHRDVEKRHTISRQRNFSKS